MGYIITFAIIILVYNLLTKKYKNPYKLYMVFGKKGSGKSTFLVKQAIRYQRRGYLVYTNMDDLCLEGVRLIDADELGDFVPPADSLLIVDEGGMIYDNRKFKSFKDSARDFYKLQRHYKVVVYIASQGFDIDAKLRTLTDQMFLIQNIATVFSLVRPISKKITLTEATAEGESRIADNLKFGSIFTWKINYLPKYFKYFESFKAPEKPLIDYREPEHPITYRKIKIRRKHKK